MASEGTGQDDELGVRLDWPGDDGGFVRRSTAPEPVAPVEEQPAPADDAPVDAADEAVAVADPEEAVDPVDVVDTVYADELADVAPATFVDEPADAIDEESFAPPSGGSMPLLPALLGKIDTATASVSTLAMRVDALGATTISMHSSFSDRLTEYVDTVSRLIRAQQETLDEYRRGNDRALAELRRGLAESDTATRAIVSRLDALVTDVGSSREETSRAFLSRVDEIAAQVSAEVVASRSDLSRVVESRLDQVAVDLATTREDSMRTVAARIDDVVAQFASTNEESMRTVMGRLDDVVAQLSSTGEGDDDSSPRALHLGAELEQELTGLREDYRRGNDRSVVELRQALSESDEVLQQLVARLDDLAADVTALRDAEPPPPPPAPPPALLSAELEEELVGLREDIVQLKRRIGLRAKSPAVLEESQIEALVARIGPRAMTADDIERVAEAVVTHLEQSLEMVPDVPAPPAPKAPAPPPPKKTPPAPAAAATKKKGAGSRAPARQRRS